MPLGRGFVGDLECGVPSILTTSASKRLPGLRGHGGAEGPVLARREGVDLAFPLDDETNGNRLDASGGQPAPDLAGDQRAQRVADEPVDDAAGLLRVHEVRVDAARIAERLLDRRPW